MKIAFAGLALALVVTSVSAQPRDGQHDFDFELGTWKTQLKRLQRPLTGSTTWVEYTGTTVVRKVWDGRAKLYVSWRLLQLRKQHEGLFRDGGYTAVRTTGEQSRHVVAFARRHGGETVITVVPRLVAGLGVRPGRTPCDRELWGEARIELPFLEEGAQLTDVFTGRELVVREGGLPVSEVLAGFPVAVLVRCRGKP